jgi:hypothetical protein
MKARISMAARAKIQTNTTAIQTARVYRRGPKMKASP